MEKCVGVWGSAEGNEGGSRYGGDMEEGVGRGEEKGVYGPWGVWRSGKKVWGEGVEKCRGR